MVVEGVADTQSTSGVSTAVACKETQRYDYHPCPQACSWRHYTTLRAHTLCILPLTAAQNLW